MQTISRELKSIMEVRGRVTDGQLAVLALTIHLDKMPCMDPHFIQDQWMIILTYHFEIN